MKGSKQEALALIERLPDDVSWSVVIEELERHRDPVTRKLDEIYADSDLDEVDPVIYAAALASIPPDKW